LGSRRRYSTAAIGLAILALTLVALLDLGVDATHQVLGMLMRHIDGVVAWAKHWLSNVALEGNNTRLRRVKKMRCHSMFPRTR